MVRLLFHRLFDAVVRLYVAESWRKEGLLLTSSSRLSYQRRSQLEIRGNCAIGVFSSMVIASTPAANDDPMVILDGGVYIGDYVSIRACGGKMSIGKKCLIADHVTIVTSNHGIRIDQMISDQEWTRGDVVIEDDVWIGAGVVVLPGTIIRRGAVIAAGAVVRGDVSPYSIFGGIPARQIGMRK